MSTNPVIWSKEFKYIVKNLNNTHCKNYHKRKTNRYAFRAKTIATRDYLKHTHPHKGTKPEMNWNKDRRVLKSATGGASWKVTGGRQKWCQKIEEKKVGKVGNNNNKNFNNNNISNVISMLHTKEFCSVLNFNTNAKNITR